MKLPIPYQGIKSKLYTFTCFAAVLLTFSGCATGSKTQPEAAKRGVVANKAMVVSAHPDASNIGLEILRKGGNAYFCYVHVANTRALKFYTSKGFRHVPERDKVQPPLWHMRKDFGGEP